MISKLMNYPKKKPVEFIFIHLSKELRVKVLTGVVHIVLSPESGLQRLISASWSLQ